MPGIKLNVFRSNILLNFLKILSTATGGAFAAGTALGWSSPTKSLLVNTTNPEYDFEITNQDFAWVGSFVTLGAALVCLFIGAVIQILGRKLTMLLLIIPFTLGWALVTFASNLSMLYVGRFLLGVSGGAFCVTAPTYTGEYNEISMYQLYKPISILILFRGNCAS